MAEGFVACARFDGLERNSRLRRGLRDGRRRVHTRAEGRCEWTDAMDPHGAATAAAAGGGELAAEDGAPDGPPARATVNITVSGWQTPDGQLIILMYQIASAHVSHLLRWNSAKPSPD